MKVVTVEKCIFQCGEEIELSEEICTHGKDNFLSTLAEVFRRHPNKREELCTGLSKECQEAHVDNGTTHVCPLAGKEIACPFYSDGSSTPPTGREWRALLVGVISAGKDREEE